MSYPNSRGEVENGMVLRPAYNNPYGDPLVAALNEVHAREDNDYAVLWSEDRFKYMERYCKAHLDDYMAWCWNNREKD
jgi:hypothetical protein